MKRLLTTILAGGAILGNFAYGKTLEEETPALAQALAKQLVAKQRPKVAALDFTNIQGMPNELGRFLAEQLAVDMVSAEGITVLDRANINSVMAEHQLTAEGLVKPENAKKLGQFAGVDALLIGHVAAMDKTFTLTVKAISTETAEVVAASRCKFDMTEDLMKQFSTNISGAAVAASGGNTAGNGNPNSQESVGIATKKFDNLEIVLKNVAPSSARNTNNRGSIPGVECSFELSNRDLKNTIVIASNGQLADKHLRNIAFSGYRGELIEPSGIRWTIPEGLLRGMSSVLGIDMIGRGAEGLEVAQHNPPAVANYVRSGRKCELGSTTQPSVKGSGRYWAGDFSTIAPGKSIRVSVKFVPEIHAYNGKQPEMPKSLQFSLELVIGTTVGEQEPAFAKNLRLENLTFDKIVMPSDTK